MTSGKLSDFARTRADEMDALTKQRTSDAHYKMHELLQSTIDAQLLRQLADALDDAAALLASEFTPQSEDPDEDG